MSNAITRAVMIAITTALAAAGLLFCLYAFKNAGDVSAAKDDVVKQMQVSNERSDLIQYAGSTMRGDNAISLMTELAGSGVAFSPTKENINPLAQYSCDVTQDARGAITQITFVEILQ